MEEKERKKKKEKKKKISNPVYSDKSVLLHILAQGICAMFCGAKNIHHTNQNNLNYNSNSKHLGLINIYESSNNCRALTVVTSKMITVLTVLVQNAYISLFSMILKKQKINKMKQMGNTMKNAYILFCFLKFSITCFILVVQSFCTKHCFKHLFFGAVSFEKSEDERRFARRWNCPLTVAGC